MLTHKAGRIYKQRICHIRKSKIIMHRLKMMVPPLGNKIAGKTLVVLAIAFTATTSVLADETLADSTAAQAIPGQTVVATIPVGSFPYGITISPDSKTVYVANSGSNNVSVIDVASNTLTTTISVGVYPEFSAITSDGKTLYVTDYGNDNVSVIDTASNTVTGTIAVGFHPEGIVITPNGKQAWVANSGTNNEGSVSFITLATGETNTVSVAGGPFWISFSPNGKEAYLLNHAVMGYFQTINVATQVISQKVLAGAQIYMPENLVVAPNGTLVVSDYYNYVADLTPGGVLKKVGLIVPTADVAIADYVGSVVVTSNGKYVYASNYSGNNVVLLTTEGLKQVGQPIPTGNEPFFMAITPNGKALYVANYKDNTVTAVNIAP
jgi:YVTN family beta-propeller protein